MFLTIRAGSPVPEITGFRMTMKLARFRVTNFRSVSDSGPIEVEAVTALIGTNESGKTNLLLPLWKLSPARDGEINPTADYPRKHFTEFRKRKPQPTFASAIFEVEDELAERVADMTGSAIEDVRQIEVTRGFDGKYDVQFPSASAPRQVPADRLLRFLDDAAAEIGRMTPMKTEGDLQDRALAAIAAAQERLAGTKDQEVDRAVVDLVVQVVGEVSLEAAAKTSTVAPRYERLKADLAGVAAEVGRPLPAEVPEATQLIIDSLPRFVYYSQYGNLDSEIYLPHVIQNMTRQDLGAKEQAKARTLKVLFEFVGLSPQEILELGQDFKPQPSGRQPTPAELEEIAEKKKKRSILLQSASSLLTERFREWWKQGDYRFRFEADGDHFRIWVSDDKRPEEIELEGRSTGLQWFLSFYLVFLVESRDAHEGAILLLDEPGLSLHPLAQRDLSAFFDGLAQTNQLLYTTHSPFLVDADRLERVRKVYVGADGTTRATPDLRAAENDAVQRSAGYAVHAALNLTVAESLMLGCEPVIVEGPSDQLYLSAIKAILTAAGRLKAGRELVFPPAGGAKGVKPVASLLLGRDEVLPVALLDSDQAGREFASALKSGLYAGDKERVLQVGGFVPLSDAEIEDLIPPEVLAREVDRLYRTAEIPFEDAMKAGDAIVPQIERWAQTEHIELVLGWKVELARRVKQALLKKGPKGMDEGTLELWERIFARLLAPDGSAASAVAEKKR